MDHKNLFNKKPLEEKDGVLYFSRPPENIRASRDEDAQNRKTWSFWRRENYAFLEKELHGLSKDKVLIDIGAGQSDFRNLTNQFKLTAVDFYPYPGVSVVCDIGDKLPFANAIADIVLITNVLEHVREPNVLLSECHRILKPGGIVIGTVPFMIQIHQRPYDFYRYTEMNLSYLFSKHQFKNAVIEPVSSLYVLLFNTTTSFFAGVIKTAKFKIFWRLIWKIKRIFFRLLKKLFENRFKDKDNPLGYLFKATK